MVTSSHLAQGLRLLESCRNLSIPVVLYEIPSVHKSISPSGSDNLSYTKASFITFLLEKYNKPILYIDGDCIMVEPPSLMYSLVETGVDFGIFNWLAEKHTEAYMPVEIQVQQGNSTVLTTDRFYGYSHSVNHFDTNQLLCSGAVQFWNNTNKAKELLSMWQQVVERNPDCPDDHCLDFAYNHPGSSIVGFKAEWFDKSYTRIAWWIYAKPVINHPDLPLISSSFGDLEQREGVPRVNYASTKLLNVEPVFPQNSLVDTVENILIIFEDQNSVQKVVPLPMNIWVK